MAKGTKRVLGTDGVWRDGPAAPQLLREDLRALPSEILTRDDQDGDKVHELDPPHIVDALVREHAAAQAGDSPTTVGDALRKLPAPPPRDYAPLTQWFIDIERIKVIRNLINNAYGHAVRTGDEKAAEEMLKVHHLWYTENNINGHAELREGNPPADSQRPKHLRGLRLEVDPLAWPQSIVDVLAESGVAIGDGNSLRREMARLKHEGAAIRELDAETDAEEAAGH